MASHYNRPSFYRRKQNNSKELHTGGNSPYLPPRVPSGSEASTSSMPGSSPVSWDIKVKIQSHAAPGGTFRLELEDVQDNDGNPCFIQLQDSIRSLAAGDQGDLSVLYLALSYVDADGDLIPLTSQEQWELAVKQHSSRPGSYKPKHLLIFAQAMKQQGGPSQTGNANLEDRLAHIEQLLTGAHMPVQAGEVGSLDGSQRSPPASTATTPTRPPKDYTALVKDHQASLESRINKVKQMNSAANSPARVNLAPESSISQEILQKLALQDEKLEKIHVLVSGQLNLPTMTSEETKDGDQSFVSGASSRPTSPTSVSTTEVGGELVQTLKVLFSTMQERLDMLEDQNRHDFEQQSRKSQNTFVSTTNMLQARLAAMETQMKQLNQSSSSKGGLSEDATALQNTFMATTNMIQSKLADMESLKEELNDTRNATVGISEDTKALQNTFTATSNMIESKLVAMEDQIEESKQIQQNSAQAQSQARSIDPNEQNGAATVEDVQQSATACITKLGRKIDALKDTIQVSGRAGDDTSSNAAGLIAPQQVEAIQNAIVKSSSKIQARLGAIEENMQKSSENATSSEADTRSLQCVQNTIMTTSNMVQARLSGMEKAIRDLQGQRAEPTGEVEEMRNSMLLDKAMMEKRLSGIEKVTREFEENEANRNVAESSAALDIQDVIKTTSNQIGTRLDGLEKMIQQLQSQSGNNPDSSRQLLAATNENIEELKTLIKQSKATSASEALSSKGITELRDTILTANNLLQARLQALEKKVEEHNSVGGGDSVDTSVSATASEIKDIKNTIISTSNLMRSRLASLERKMEGVSGNSTCESLLADEKTAASLFSLSSKDQASTSTIRESLTALSLPEVERGARTNDVDPSNRVLSRLASFEKMKDLGQQQKQAQSKPPPLFDITKPFGQKTNNTKRPPLFELPKSVGEPAEGSSLSSKRPPLFDIKQSSIKAGDDDGLSKEMKRVEAAVVSTKESLQAQVKSLETKFDQFALLQSNPEKRLLAHFESKLEAQASSLQGTLEEKLNIQSGAIQSELRAHATAGNNSQPRYEGNSTGDFSSIQAVQHTVMTSANMIQAQLGTILHEIKSLQTAGTSLPTNDNASLASINEHVSHKINALQQHLDKMVGTVLDASAGQQSSSISFPSSQAKAASTLLPTSDSDISILHERLIQLQDRWDTSFEQLESKLSKQFLLSQDSMLQNRSQLVQELAKKIGKMLDSSQTTILKNEKQYASALRQTMLKLHDETRNHVVSIISNSATGGEKGQATSSGAAGSVPVDYVKQIILSSTNELQESQREALKDHRTYLDECTTKILKRLPSTGEKFPSQTTPSLVERMPRTHRLIDSPVSEMANDPTATTSALSVASRDLSGAGGEENEEGLAVAAVAVEQMESILMSAIEKLEAAMESNCEHIQAQAVGVILEKVENLANKLDSTQGVVLEKISTCRGSLEGALTIKLDATHSIVENLETKFEAHKMFSDALNAPPSSSMRSQKLSGSRRGQRSHQRRERDLGEYKNNEDYRADLYSARASMDSSMMSSSRNAHYILNDKLRTSSASVGGGEDSMQLEKRFMEIETRAMQLEHAYDCIRFDRDRPALSLKQFKGEEKVADQ